MVERVIVTERFTLLERLAERDRRGRRWPTTASTAVTVAVRKLRPPVPQQLATVGRPHQRPMTAAWRRRHRGRSSASARTSAIAGGTCARRSTRLPDVVARVAGLRDRSGRRAAGQGPYLNLVVELDTDASPRQLLGLCHRLEAAAGRVRGERWGPRTLDVDILWIDGVTVDEPDLSIPHPRMCERRFVLVPLADLAPELVPDAAGRTVDGWVTPASSRL